MTRDVLGYYAAHFRTGMVDLSQSSPPARLAPRSLWIEPAALGYCEPGGLPQLRELIADRYRGVTADDVVVTSGASEALSAAGHALLRRDGVLVAAPGTYPSLLAAARRCGTRVVSSTEGIASATAVAVTNPSAPGGELLDLGAVGRLAASLGARLIADEVHGELYLGDQRPPRAVEISDTAVSIGDLSKSAGMGGLRIGWLVCRDRELVASVREEVQLLSGGPSHLSMEAALEVLGQLDGLAAALRRGARDRGREVVGVLRSHGWSAALPAAGSTLLGRPPYPVGPESLERLAAAGLFILPGEPLGFPGAFRVSLFAPLDQIERALEILEGASRGPGRGSIVVLTKVPRAGFAKTRLAGALGEAGSALLARAFLLDTLSLARRSHRSMLVAVAPAGQEAALDGIAPAAAVVSQCEGTLGERIEHALAVALTRSPPAVLIGSDTPDLSPRLLDEAFGQLQTCDVVLGPARDGGFYLIGCSRIHPGLLEDVAWSTEQVLARVLRNASALGLRVALLDEHEDVDDAASLAALVSRLRSGSHAPATAAALGALELEGAR